jgi:hypothetical protein
VACNAVDQGSNSGHHKQGSIMEAAVSGACGVVNSDAYTAQLTSGMHSSFSVPRMRRITWQ